MKKTAIVTLGLLLSYVFISDKPNSMVTYVLGIIFFLAIGIGGLWLGPWIIYSVIVRKAWIERTQYPPLWGFGDLFPKGANCFLMGVAITIFAVFFIFAVGQEYYPSIRSFLGL